MDVIEHLPDPKPWLVEALRVVRPGGLVFLTTPNYGSVSLRILEATALEAVARAQGFSRKELHPSKLEARSLTELLVHAGARDIAVSAKAFGWVLAAFARKGTP